MEESLPLLLHGCKLAKDLEENIPNLANRSDIILKSCEEIIRVFSNIKDRLSREQMNTLGQPHELQQLDHIGTAGIQQWLRTSGTTSSHQAMDLLNSQAILSNRSTYIDHACDYESSKMKGTLLEQQQSGLEFMVRELSGGRDMGSLRGLTSGENIQLSMNAPDSSTTSSSAAQRQRKRKNNEGDKIVKRVAAPQMGNLDLPPEDGFTWRKYGQKEILGSRYPSELLQNSITGVITGALTKNSTNAPPRSKSKD